MMVNSFSKNFAPPPSHPLHCDCPHAHNHPGVSVNLAIILLYLAALIFCGYMGKRRAKNAEYFRLAGRRLGPLPYTGTMSAVVLGGASTVGGVGLGYTLMIAVTSTAAYASIFRVMFDVDRSWAFWWGRIFGSACSQPVPPRSPAGAVPVRVFISASTA